MADTKKAPGCGWTERKTMTELIKMASDQYLAQLDQLPRLSGRAKNDLAAGFRDGLRTALVHLEGMGVLVVVGSIADLDVDSDPTTWTCPECGRVHELECDSDDCPSKTEVAS